MKTGPFFRSEMYKDAIFKRYDSVLAGWINADQKYISTRFGNTHVIASGTKGKTPLVLLHGSASNSSVWTEERKALEDDFMVYAIDIPGEAGKSQEVRPALKDDSFIEWMEDVYKGLEIKKAVVCGVSLGGWIALKWASSHSECLSGLVLVSTGGIVNPNGLFLLKAVFHALRGRNGADGFMKMLFGKMEINEEVRDYFRLIAEGFSPRTGSIPLFSDESLARLNMPVLYIGGADDEFYDSRKAASRVADIVSHAQTILLENTGHVVTGIGEMVKDFDRGVLA